MCDFCNTRQYRKEARAFYRKSPEYNRASRLLHKFGLTLEDYDRILASQGSVCAICEGVEVWKQKNATDVAHLAVDHDHETGKVRGLLCANCNKILGHAHDDIAKLFRAIEYLRKHSPQRKIA